MGGAALPLPADRGYVPQTAVLLRFLAAALIFGAVALACEPVLLARALPVFSGWLDLVDGTFHTLDLRVREINGELMIVRTAVPAVIHVLGGHVVAADPRSMLSASASAGIILQPLVLAAALLLAWPWRRLGELPVRILLAIPLMGAVLLLDVPTLLYGMLWNQEVSVLEPERFSLLITWTDFMNAGGRFALTIAAVAAAGAGARRLLRPRSPRVPSPPGPAATALPAAPPSR
jgi:hypothetical protein